MSWSDYYQRRDAVDAVLRQAQRHPERPLPFAEVAKARSVFTGPGELLGALHYRWMQRLTAKVELAVQAADRNTQLDRVELVTQAWQHASRAEPALRRLLDEGASQLGTTLDREYRMLALASGLAESYESDAEITRIGAAFHALVNTGHVQHQVRSGARGRLLRLLVPSA